MQSAIKTIISHGSGGLVVDAECHISNGLPSIIIVGLGNKAVDESKERVRSAFASQKISLPRKRITINLAPADVPKDSTSLDLAIATAILTNSGMCQKSPESNAALIGELGLDGTIRPVRGIIGKLLWGTSQGLTRFYLPAGNLQQALLVPGITVVPLSTIKELYTALNGQTLFKPQSTGPGIAPEAHAAATEHALSEIAGQEVAKRALEIAAAGGHNVFLSGPPGTGKTMLAKALLSLLPPLGQQEMLEITHLHSLVGGRYEELVLERPFRAPHHTASQVSIVGGGNQLRPGEITLAHRGVLFFDELPEFARGVIEALRQPLEDRAITIARAKETARYPANFILVATANPCPCGYFGTKEPCVCPAYRIAHYRQKLSGPIMDRVDLHVQVEAVEHTKLLEQHSVSDDGARERVVLARQGQNRRYASQTKLNNDMTNQDIRELAQLSPEAHATLNTAASRLKISARSYMRVVKVARTIADLARSPTIDTIHITEALQYRPQSLQALDLI